MAAKPRVHEIGHELGVDSKVLMDKLKELGEFVKSPSSTIEPPVARKLRAALIEDGAVERTPSMHPDAAAARARRDIVRRVDSNWGAYGLSDPEKKRWIGAGIPEENAPIAAMCRDSERRGRNPSRLMPANLRRRLGDEDSSERVIDVLLAGANSLRVQERLAWKLGLAITDVNPDLRRVATSTKLDPESTTSALGKAFAGLPWDATSAVRRADAAAEIVASLVPVTSAHTALRDQVRQYRTQNQVGPLLAAYARLHGVHSTGQWLHALCDAVPGEVDAYVGALDAASLVERAVAARRFYFLRADAVAVLEAEVPLNPAASGSRAVTALGDEESISLPPSPDGVALLEPELDAHLRSARIVFWTTEKTGHIRVAMIEAGQLASFNLSRLIRVGASVETWTPEGGGTHSGAAARFLDAFAVRRSRTLGRKAPRDNVGQEMGSSTSISDPEPGPATRTESTAIRDVVISYFARSSSDDMSADGSFRGGQARDRRSPDHRWTVRGHWRRQWYPREKLHRRVWIKEHHAGPADHPLLLVERVEAH